MNKKGHTVSRVFQEIILRYVAAGIALQPKTAVTVNAHAFENWRYAHLSPIIFVPRVQQVTFSGSSVPSAALFGHSECGHVLHSVLNSAAVLMYGFTSASTSLEPSSTSSVASAGRDGRLQGRMMGDRHRTRYANDAMLARKRNLGKGTKGGEGGVCGESEDRKIGRKEMCSGDGGAAEISWAWSDLTLGAPHGREAEGGFPGYRSRGIVGLKEGFCLGLRSEYKCLRSFLLSRPDLVPLFQLY